MAVAPLDVVVRFASSELSDLVLRIDQPGYLSNASLKQRLRAQLPRPSAQSRLRLIHAGKVLVDANALSKSVTVVPAPTSAAPTVDDAAKSTKAKGKQPVRDTSVTTRVYIHCSVGDVLSGSKLADEQSVAQDADAALALSGAGFGTTTTPIDSDADPAAATASTTTPAPRGFDRLLTAGFTASEVAQLRAQFLAIQAHTHTPDTMPTGAALLALEERWLDNTSQPDADGAALGDTGGFGADSEGGLEDMLYGNLIGFFWPVGAICWLMREEGVWSRRRQVAVLSGFLVNLTFGFLHVMS